MSKVQTVKKTDGMHQSDGHSRFLQNLLKITRIATANLMDDPLHFLFQVGRRIDSPVVSKISQVAVLALPQRAIVSHAFACLMSGNSTELSEYAQQLDVLELPDRTVARVADMLLAIQDSETAGILLQGRAHNTTTLNRTRARYAWYLGQMDLAIEILANTVPGTNKQLRHYRSELAVFEGALACIPRMTPATDVRTNKTALHFLTNSLPHTGSGYAQRTHSILTALHAAGWNTQVFTRVNYPLVVGKATAKNLDTVSSIEYRRILPRKLKTEMLAKIQQQAEALADAVSRNRPSILHTTTDFTNALSVMAVAEAYELPWVYEVRGQLADTWASSRPESAKSSQRYKLFKEREAFVAARASHVVTLGEAMKQELIAQGVARNRITISPNAIGDDYLEPPISRLAAREALGLSSEHQYVGTVSSLVAYEGLDLLVHAFADLVPRNPMLRLLVVGSGVERNNLIELSEKLGVGKYCIFPGRVPREEARTYHCAMDIFVVPRRDLSVTQVVTPLKPVEALACEVPVVAADLPALREIVVHGRTGLLVDPDNAGKLAQAIENLLRDSSKRASMGVAGRARVLAERTWGRNTHKLLKVYEELAEKMR
ncbi:glycosyltransferase family 4 protein [Paeniglutamicibacter sp. NPDC012692]|uniref:glycosyltransferase family 4 protein n=1 Tax=Paeniglutamicibacter sp. NPDC012692 TaxID=3364388 RepID=UPI00369F9563